jgi:adenylate cyclase
VLEACIPAGQPAVSLTLSERAMQAKQGLIWNRDAADTSRSLVQIRSETGMYAPLLWQGQALGVICVETRKLGHTFQPNDLRLLVAVAHHAAMAIANHQLQENLQRQSILLERLLTSFSPKLREKILEKAARGRLALGGERSEVTILFSDIRGFTKLISSMPADHVGEMLNSYFSVLVDAIFRHDGTVDKFIGDAILAVFGSPEADPDHYAKAVRAAMDMQSAISALNHQIRSNRLWYVVNSFYEVQFLNKIYLLHELIVENFESLSLPEFGKSTLLPEEVPTHYHAEKFVHQDIVEDDGATDDLLLGQL